MTYLRRNSEQGASNYEPLEKEDEPIIKKVCDDRTASNGGCDVRILE